MNSTATQTTNMPADKITLANLTSYLAYLKHLPIDPNDNTSAGKHLSYPPEPVALVPLDEPKVSQEVKDIAHAITEGLGNIYHFTKRCSLRWLFHGWAALTPDRQYDTAVFFYANKDNLIEVMDDIIATKGGEDGNLGSWLFGMGLGCDDEKVLLATWKEVKEADTAKAEHQVDFAGMMIAQILYQILYYAELEYHTKYRKREA